jgi:adenylate kinase family enzyme
MSSRVLILGGSGSGKSTFADKLGKELGLKVFHLDTLYYKPGWVKPEQEDFQKIIDRICEESEGIFDGVYTQSLEQRVIWSNKIYYLDIPLYTRLWRITKRMIGVFLGFRPRLAMAPGCPERLDLGFIKWTINFDKNHKPKVFEILDKYRASRDIEIVRN